MNMINAIKSALRILFGQWISNIFPILFFIFLSLSGHFAFADSSSPSSLTSSNPGLGNDPWALFQLMISIGTEVWYVIKIVLLISGVAGLIFIILGLLKIRAHALDSQGSGGHLKHGIVLVILGGVLFGVPTWIQLTGNSLFGSAPAPVTTQASVNCQMVNGSYEGPGCGNPCVPGANQAPGGSGMCICPAGSGTDASGACSPCAAGSGNPTPNGTCQPCSSNNITVNGICTPCPNGEAVYNGACIVCSDQHFAMSGGACAPCSPGTGVDAASEFSCVPCASVGAYGMAWNSFNSSTQNWTCVTCPSDSSPLPPSTSSPGGGCQCAINGAVFNFNSCSCPGQEVNVSGTCLCPSNEVSSGASGMCTCASGYLMAQGSTSCEPCSTSNDNYGQYDACPCASGMYSNGVPSYKHCPVYQCTDPNNETFNGNSCVCNGPNSGLYNGVCTPCVNGTLSGEACTCPSQSKMTASGCSPCGSGDYGQDAACICGASTNTYAPAYPNCPSYPCQPNDYQVGDPNCPCTSATTPPGYPHCPSPCPANSSPSSANPQVCLCSDGTQGLYDGSCVNCSQGYVSPQDGTCQCNPNDGGAAEIVVGVGCVVCSGASGEVVNTSNGTCQCPSGQALINGSCFCNSGTKDSASGCVPCALSDYSPQGGPGGQCPCGLDKFSNGNPAYPSCPAGKLFAVNLPTGCFFDQKIGNLPPTGILCAKGKKQQALPSGCDIHAQSDGSFINNYGVYCETQTPSWPAQT